MYLQWCLNTRHKPPGSYRCSEHTSSAECWDQLGSLESKSSIWSYESHASKSTDTNSLPRFTTILEAKSYEHKARLRCRSCKNRSAFKARSCCAGWMDAHLERKFLGISWWQETVGRGRGSVIHQSYSSDQFAPCSARSIWWSKCYRAGFRSIPEGRDWSLRCDGSSGCQGCGSRGARCCPRNSLRRRRIDWRLWDKAAWCRARDHCRGYEKGSGRNRTIIIGVGVKLLSKSKRLSDIGVSIFRPNSVLQKKNYFEESWQCIIICKWTTVQYYPSSNGLPQDTNNHLGLTERKYFHRQVCLSWVSTLCQYDAEFYFDEMQAPWEGGAKLSQILKSCFAFAFFFSLRYPLATPPFRVPFPHTNLSTWRSGSLATMARKTL